MQSSKKDQKDTLEINFKNLFYSIENTFPGNDFSFNKITKESKARLVLPSSDYIKEDKIIEIELENIEQSIKEAIWTIKEITRKLDA